MLTKWSALLLVWIVGLQTASCLYAVKNDFRGAPSCGGSFLKVDSLLRIRGGEGTGAPPPPQDSASEVTIKFLKRNVSELQSYLSYLQEYQNPMVARAWPANTNFVSVSETVTDTVFRNSLRAESKGLVYREWVRAGPRKQTLFTPSEVNAAIVACGGLDPGINVVVREICSTLDFAYNVRRAWGVRYGWRGFTDRAAQVPLRKRADGRNSLPAPTSKGSATPSSYTSRGSALSTPPCCFPASAYAQPERIRSQDQMRLARHVARTHSRLSTAYRRKPIRPHTHTDR